MDDQPKQPNQSQAPESVQSADPSLIPPTDADPPTQTPYRQPRSRNRGKFIAAIVVVLAVLLGGSVLAYRYWYQNPEKVVTDGIVNAMAADTMQFKLVGDVKGSAPGRVTLNGVTKNGAFNIDAHIKTKSRGADVDIHGGGLMDEKGDLYLKVSNLGAFVDSTLGKNKAQVPLQLSSAIYGFVTKVNGKWIKVSSSDLKSFSESIAKQQSCMSDTFKKLREDKAMKAEVTGLYKRHKFITVTKELGSRGDSSGYELSTDKTQAKEFASGLKDTRLYKNLHECSQEFSIDENDFMGTGSSSNETKVEVWVNRWSHEITKVTANVNDKEAPGTVTFEPTFNEPVTIEAPKESMGVKELAQEIADLEKAIIDAYKAYAPSRTPLAPMPSSLLN